MTLRKLFLPLLLLVGSAPSAAAMQQGAKVDDFWQPAKTPQGGISWRTLEKTKLNDRTDADGMIVTKPTFTPQVKKLNGKRIKVAGWVMPLDNGTRQKHFVLLAYPPGCPFHLHALPNQFIEVYADSPITVDMRNPMTITGTLELTGYDESGIFYRLKRARRG